VKKFRVTVQLGATEIDPPDADLERVEEWLENNLQPIMSLFEGYGRIYVSAREDGTVNVEVDFIVEGNSSVDVFDRHRSHFETVQILSRGFEITESATFRPSFFKIEGEQLYAFVRFNPETNKPMYSSG
jgi:hypothetical protein